MRKLQPKTVSARRYKILEEIDRLHQELRELPERCDPEPNNRCDLEFYP